jgi:predicted nucleic acid-binding protein
MHPRIFLKNPFLRSDLHQTASGSTHIIALEGDEYADALQASAVLGIVGGGIYDAMLAHCAMQAQVETIYSWNGRHYALCGPEVTRRLWTP